MFDEEILEAVGALVNALKSRGLFVTTAESCTGGLIAGAITSVAGASDCFGTGFITYANEAKMQMLGVKGETLQTRGAVSEETAREMAAGALMQSGAGLALAVTGIAGPGGGSADKPVGLVYIGVAGGQSGDMLTAQRFDFGDIGRDAVRRETVLAALKLGLAALD